MKIIHRDIKPSNLLLGNGLKTLKISDFGLAKQVDVGSHTSAIGTCWYMAPEVIRTRKYSFSADIYSLAITIWELFSRRRPYYHLGQISHYNLLIDVVGGERPLFDGSVDETVVAFLTRALSADPDQRPALTEFLNFAETADEQINGNINGRERDAQQTSVSEVPLLIGGLNHYMEILDVEANTWKQLSSSLPYEPIVHGSAILDGEIYIFGGWLEESKSAYKLTKEMKWKKLPAMIEGRCGISNSTVVFDGCIWVIGGYSSGCLDSVKAYRPKSNSWIRKPCLNKARCLAAAAVLKGRIFVCGGYESSGYARKRLNSVEYFDPKLSKWIFSSPMPAPRYALPAVAQDCFLTVMGGYDDLDEPSADVWTMNVDEPQPKWSVLASMSSPRADLAAWIFDDRIMVTGGNQGSNRPLLSSVEVFDGKEWTKGPSLQSGTIGMTATLVPQNLARSLLATYPPA